MIPSVGTNLVPMATGVLSPGHAYDDGDHFSSMGIISAIRLRAIALNGSKRRTIILFGKNDRRINRLTTPLINLDFTLKLNRHNIDKTLKKPPYLTFTLALHQAS
jgi:hypothetical protein